MRAGRGGHYRPAARPGPSPVGPGGGLGPPGAGSRGADFWTEELLDYLEAVTTDLTTLADGGRAR